MKKPPALLTMPLALVVLKELGGVQGALHTRAPRSRANCMMLFSTVPPAGVMRVRRSESPRPVLVEKYRSATVVFQVLRHAEDAPKPSMRWKRLVQLTVQIAFVGGTP